MKRINLSVDIEDNEIFEKSVNQAIIGQAKQIARETIEKEFTTEIERIIDAKVEEVKTASYWSPITTRITDALIKRLDSEISINSHEIQKIFEQKVSEYLDKKLGNEKYLDTLIESYMKKSLASLLLDKANQ